MSLRVNTNMPAINSHRNLITNNAEQAKTMERLSSGLKINRGADGPAALVISERLRSQTAGLKQAIDNSEAGVALVQTAEAALNEVSSALINARQLAVASANEAVNDEFMLRANQQEIDNILATVTRIAKNTQFGQKNLLDGSKGATGVQTPLAPATHENTMVKVNNLTNEVNDILMGSRSNSIGTANST